MAKITIDLVRNNDGTITAKYGKHRASFKVEPWMTQYEIVDRARWELISLGASISEEVVKEATDA